MPVRAIRSAVALRPDADTGAGALLVAGGRLDLPKSELPKRETDHEKALNFRV
jgi:glucosamine kinase